MSLGERRRSQCYLWGEATDDAGRIAVARLRTADAYDLTVHTALAVAGRLLNGTIAPGFQTPALAFGADFILEIEGVVRVDEPSDRTPAA